MIKNMEQKGVKNRTVKNIQWNMEEKQIPKDF